MQKNEQNSSDTDTSGHIGAVIGLVIGIVLGSAILNVIGTGVDDASTTITDNFGASRTEYRSLSRG